MTCTPSNVDHPQREGSTREDRRAHRGAFEISRAEKENFTPINRNTLGRNNGDISYARGDIIFLFALYFLNFGTIKKINQPLNFIHRACFPGSGEIEPLSSTGKSDEESIFFL